MKTVEHVRIAEMARHLWFIKQKHYVFLEDVANSNLLKARQSQIKTPSLKKMGRFVYNYPYFTDLTLLPTALDIYNNMPKRYSIGCFLKKTHAFSIQARRSRKEDDYSVLPIVVTLYGLKKDETEPKELQDQTISVFGDKFNSSDLDRFKMYI